jgi:hypothetical protein
MPLKVIASGRNTIPIHSYSDFEKVFGIGYLPTISFKDKKTQDTIERLCSRMARKQWISAKQKWLGHFYAPAIHGTIHLDLTIAWIDEKTGYGVWTNTDIPALAYIGEYTGMLRKRSFFGRWKNLYCFDYSIAEGKKSGYVIDAQDFGNYTRFINHSSEPNLEPASAYCNGTIHIIIYAKNPIPSGTQLCYDYGEDYWKKREQPSLIISH